MSEKIEFEAEWRSEVEGTWCIMAPNAPGGWRTAIIKSPGLLSHAYTWCLWHPHKTTYLPLESGDAGTLLQAQMAAIEAAAERGIIIKTKPEAQWEETGATILGDGEWVYFTNDTGTLYAVWPFDGCARFVARHGDEWGSCFGLPSLPWRRVIPNNGVRHPSDPHVEIEGLRESAAKHGYRLVKDDG